MFLTIFRQYQHDVHCGSLEFSPNLTTVAFPKMQEPQRTVRRKFFRDSKASIVHPNVGSSFRRNFSRQVKLPYLFVLSGIIRPEGCQESLRTLAIVPPPPVLPSGPAGRSRLKSMLDWLDALRCTGADNCLRSMLRAQHA